MVLGGEKSKWIHSRESLTNGRVTYTVKFMGKAEVPDSRGMPMVKAALQKLSFSRQIKRSEGAKPPKVELGISIHSVSISDIKTKETLHNIGLHRVSFCADDKEDKRLFAFIAKLDDNKHYCYGLDSIHQANDITLTIGQAFELAYEKFRKEKKSVQVKESALPHTVTKVTDMSRRIQELESENNELRQRIADLEAAQRRIQYGNGVTSTTPPAQVSVKLLAAPSPIQFNTENIALPRSSPAQTNPSLPSFNSTSLPTSLPTSLSSCTRPSDDSTLIDIDAVNSGLTQDSTQLKSIYTSMNRGPGDQEVRNEIGNSREQNTSSAVSSSVRKFRNSLQRNMRKTMASEEKMKKTLTSLFPSKMISKKLRKGKNEEPERKFALLDDSAGSSCSSSRSSTYANLDDVIATLQKMMDKGESTTRSSKLNRQAQLEQPASFIGEKLATHHDLAQLNYDTIPRRAPKPKEMYGQQFTNTAETNHTSVQGSIIQQPTPRSKVFLQTEVMNSNDDLSSLSTTTTDSSSRECVYVLQPTNSTTKDANARNASVVAHHHNKTHSKKIHPKPVKYEAETRHIAKLAVKQMPTRQSNMRDRRDPTDHVWPGTNIDSTLRQLGGEEGYMVLSGRKQVEQILAKTPMSNVNAMEQDICVDSTYDNVSRLMEAVREAAARDAQKRGGDAREILMTTANTKPLLNTQRHASDVHTTSWMEGGRPISTPASAHASTNRASNSRNINTDLSTIAFGSTNPAFHSNQQVSSMIYRQPPEYLTSDGRFPTSIPFQPHSASSNRQFAYSGGMHSQETDILYGQDQMASPLTSLRLTSEDAFNMQPFVPPSNMSRLPQPPSRKPVKPQGDLWSHDPFDPIQKPSRTSKEVLDMQSLSESSDTTPRSKKSNYHIVSHPLIRKKHRTKQKIGLKWNKKYYPNGKKKSNAKRKSPTAAEIISLNNAFSKGLVMSEENLTLDSFDPLKH